MSEFVAVLIILSFVIFSTVGIFVLACRKIDAYNQAAYLRDYLPGMPALRSGDIRKGRGLALVEKHYALKHLEFEYAKHNIPASFVRIRSSAGRVSLITEVIVDDHIGTLPVEPNSHVSGTTPLIVRIPALKAEQRVTILVKHKDDFDPGTIAVEQWWPHE